MSTRLLYHSWSLRGIVYRATRHGNGGTHFHVSLARDILRCPACDNRDVQTAEHVFDQWCITAETSGVKILQDAAKQLRL